MPLFMFIVGYFSKSSVSIGFIEMLKKKWKSLMVPMLIYCFILTLIDLIGASSKFGSPDPLLDGRWWQDCIWGGGKLLFHNILNGYWFVWAIMYSVIFYRAVNHILKNGVFVVSVISFALIMIIPRTFPIPGFIEIQSMYPFFILGLNAREYNLIGKLVTSQIKFVVVPLCILAFTYLYSKYQYENFFYLFRFISTYDWLKSYAMMIIAAVSAIILILLAARRLSSLKQHHIILDFMTNIGQFTLSIYLMQGVLCHIGYLMNYGKISWGLYFLIAVLVYVSLGYIAINLAKFRITSKYLLGKTYTQQ